MKIAHLTSVHGRYDVRIFDKICTSLAACGYNVSLVVADGKGFERRNNVNIFDVGAPASRVDRMWRSTSSILMMALELDADVYHFHDPELIPAGIWLRCQGKLVIYDIHEDTRRQILLKTYIPRVLRMTFALTFGALEDLACRAFSGVVTPQMEMSEHYQRFTKVATVCNFVDVKLYDKRVVDFKVPVLLHAGSLSKDRGLENMLKAIEAYGNDISMTLAGSLEKGWNLHGRRSIEYIGEVSYIELLKCYLRSNIGIILYNNVGQYGMSGAVKSFEYMASSMPIIMPNFGGWVRFNEEVQCGINVTVTDPSAVCDAIRFFVDNPAEAKRLGMNGRAWVETKFSWDLAFSHLTCLYSSIYSKGEVVNIL